MQESPAAEALVNDNDLDFTIDRLGECRLPSPLVGLGFTDDDEHVLYHATLAGLTPWLDRGARPPTMEAAGPRRLLYFDPATVACGIVTCGGLCPGLNDVIRAIVLNLHRLYGARTVYGFRFGYEGLVPRFGHQPVMLTPDSVRRIHECGGTILGSSRGHQDPTEMADYLHSLGVGVLFAIGGDGTLRGAQRIAEAARQRGHTLGVIGVPKTIDNDISYVQRTFGFETAVSEAQRATVAATAEAEGARNGIGLVKLMGRDSGFIAAYSALVNSDVDFCLVPEVRFTIEGLLSALGRRLEQRGHAVIVVAEGAGQDQMAARDERDASGNVRYGDIGMHLRDVITAHFKRVGTAITLKYIDPGYTIRSVQATPHDAAFCLLLGQHAVHAGLSGRTNMVVSFWNHQFTHVPIALATSERKKIDPDGPLWESVITSTRQPRDMR